MKYLGRVSKKPECFKAEIPALNPLKKIQYVSFWKEQKRRCVEGFWVEGTWMPGPLYFYINYAHIWLNLNLNSKYKTLALPFLRDLEWYKSRVYEAIRGFSGFEHDNAYTCHHMAVEQGFMWKHKANGTYSVIGEPSTHWKLRWIHPLEYLGLNFSEPMGRAEYHNQNKNIVDIEGRGGGKSFWAASMVSHNFLFDGARRMEDYENPIKSETMIAGIHTNYIKDLASKVETILENLPGAVTVNGVLYPSPFSKKYSGTFKSSKVEAKYQKKVGNTWKTFGSGSIIHMRSFQDNPLAANGTRPNLIVYDEIGFAYNLLDSYGQLKECMQDGANKFGSFWGMGTGGDMDGGCVVAGSKVYTADGILVNVEDLSQEQGILGFDYDNQKVSREPITWIKPPDEKECVRITTRSGRVIECSDDHPILWSKWLNFRKSYSVYDDGIRKRVYEKKVEFREAGKIEVGDQLAIADKIDIWGTVSNPEAWLLGMSLGDGCYYNNSLTISNCDPDINNFLEAEYNTSLAASYLTKKGDVYKELRILGMNGTIREQGMFKQTGLNKQFPKDIWNWDKTTLCLFLGGYFDADGSVVKDSIEITSICQHLISGLQLLLGRLGIHGNIYVKKAETRVIKTREVSCKESYRFRIKDRDSVIRFYENIRFVSHQKQEKLKACYDHHFSKLPLRADNLHGLRFEKVKSIERIGKLPVYNLEAGNTHTYIVNNIVTHNSTHGVKEMFYNPESYDCLVFPDEFESTGGNIGFFVPASLTLNQFKDEYGNTKIHLSEKYLAERREHLAKQNTKKPYLDELQQQPLRPSEAFLVSNVNLFPVDELQEHLNYLESIKDDYSRGIHGKVIGVEGKDGSSPWVRFVPNESLMPADYPIKKGKQPEGCLVIWGEVPTSPPPFGQYIAALDPYNQDEAAESVSVGSMLVYKTTTFDGETSNMIVAEYSGRPKTLDEFNENVLNICRLFNCPLMVENMFKNTKQHFQMRGALGYMAYTPTIFKATKDSKVNRTYGLHMTVEIRKEAELYLRDWLNEEWGDGKKNLHKIYSKPLLKELIAYNQNGNFDRVDALLHLNGFRLERINRKVKAAAEKKRDSFFEKTLYTRR